MIERGAIEVAPLAFMRGRTLNDSFIILDEAQNATVEQMNTVVKKWIDPSAISYFKAGDFKKAGVTK